MTTTSTGGVPGAAPSEIEQEPQRAQVITPFDAPIQDDVSMTALPDDERMWVPIGERASVRPLLFDTAAGSWVNLLRVQGEGVVGRHLHPGPVHGFVLKGRWRYLEHDWIAEPGHYIYEPPGDVHTLTLADGCDEMITWFHASGGLVYLDAHTSDVIKIETVHTRIDLARKHYREVGLDPALLDPIIR